MKVVGLEYICISDGDVTFCMYICIANPTYSSLYNVNRHNRIRNHWEWIEDEFSF